MRAAPDPSVNGVAQAARLEGELRRAVEGGRVGEALRLIEEARGLAQGSTSSLVVTTYLLCVVRAAPLARQETVDMLALARSVVETVEPWFGADVEQFAEVAEGARHAALHALMHNCAEAGRLDEAITIRRLDEAGNQRCRRRWTGEQLASTPGCHALYPNAYGDAQLVGHLAAAGRFEDVPALMERMGALTASADLEPETRDACGEAEAGALLGLMRACGLSDALRAAVGVRIVELRRLADPPGAWPRTLAALAF